MSALVPVTLLLLTAAPDAAGRAKRFDTWLEPLRRYHVFSDAAARALGSRFEDEVPALREEATAAQTPLELGVALSHLVNALHDPHVAFTPAVEHKPLTTGLRFDVEFLEGAPRFWVREVEDPALAASVREGDVLVKVTFAGRELDAAELPHAWRFDSNENGPRGVAHDLARLLGERVPGVSLAAPEGPVRYVLRHRDGSAPFTVETRWRPAPRYGFSDFELDFEEASGCLGLAPRAYPKGYQLVGGGARFCLYAARDAAHRGFPIVRHASFLYVDLGKLDLEAALRLARTDHELLQKGLAALGPLRGVVLDLRDNRGGNNPNWFLDWYAPGPWVDHVVRTRVHADLEDTALRQKLHLDAPWYVRALAAPRSPDGLSPARPFFCPPDGPPDCAWDNTYRPQHRVTTAPVALLVGPGCVSSCDSFAQHFAEFGFGPLIGEPTTSAYTTARAQWPVTAPDGTALGSLELGLSASFSGKSGAALEAVPLPIDVLVERTFEGRDTWDARLVDAACARLSANRKR